MKIFISHKQEDTLTANQIASELRYTVNPQYRASSLTP